MTGHGESPGDCLLQSPGGPVGRVRWEGHWTGTRTAILWLPGMFDNSDTRPEHAPDDIRGYLAGQDRAFAELDYPSHLTSRPEELARVRTSHLLDLLDLALRRMTALSPGAAVTVVGHSLGAKLAVLGAERNPAITGVVLVDGWLVGPPGTAPLRPNPPVLELFGHGTRFKEMCAAVAREDSSPSTQKFLSFAVDLLRRRGMLGEQAALTAEEDQAFRRRMFSCLSRLDPLWPGGQKDELSRYARMDRTAWTARWRTARRTALPVLSITCGSRPAWYEEAAEATLSAMDGGSIERSRLAHRGHLDVLFGRGAGAELGNIIVDWLRERAS